MHYSQHSQVKPEDTKKSGKLHSAIEKAQAIQQREQLRQMVTEKFNKDLPKEIKTFLRSLKILWLIISSRKRLPKTL